MSVCVCVSVCLCVCVKEGERERERKKISRSFDAMLDLKSWSFGIIKTMLLFRTMRVFEIAQ